MCVKRTVTSTLIFLLVNFIPCSAFSFTSITRKTNSFIKRKDERLQGNMGQVTLSLSSSSSSSSSPSPPPSTKKSTETITTATASTATGTGTGTKARTTTPHSLLFDDNSLSSVFGEADRSFRLGVELEKNGLARASAASFHEAATLYQCFLDNTRGNSTNVGSNEFGHVTVLDPDGIDGCRPVLAYATLRLAHLSHDALGDSRAATRLYKDASIIDPIPSYLSYDGIGTSIEASNGNLFEAVKAYREALRLVPSNTIALFHLAVVLERLGESEESDSIMEKLRRSEANRSCLVDSWGYVRWHTRKIANDKLNLHRGTRDMLQIALEAASPLIKAGGMVCEFGVASGRSLRMIQEMLPLNTPIHGFDTFTGLPQAWGTEPVGTYSTGGLMPNMEGAVFFHKGLFSESIPTFLETNERLPLAFANIDCDLYTSTYDILEAMQSRIIPGTVIIFDEYLCHPTWRQDEFRAWRECCKRFGWQYEYLGFSLGTKQAVVQVRE